MEPAGRQRTERRPQRGTAELSRAGGSAGVHRLLPGPGAPLTGAAARRFTPLLGHRISEVRVHDDSAAARSAEAVGARAYTVGSHVVFGSGQYDPDSRDGDRLLTHELVHVAQQPGARPVPENLAPAPHDDPLEQQARAVTAGRLSPANLPVTSLQRPGLYRIGLGELIGRFLGGGTFSAEELQTYLRFLDERDRIEDRYDSDNKAREVVRHWKRGDSAYLLSARRKTLLIREMLSGFTGDDDENAILDLLRGATDSELPTILSAVGVSTLHSNLHFEQQDELDRLLAARGVAAGRPAESTTDVFAAETVLALQERFRANSESANRLNCILIIRELAPQLFEQDPEVAARVQQRLAELTGTRLTMVEVGRALSDLGLSSDSARIRFGNGNGSREPTVMQTSAWDTVVGMVGGVQGWHVFGMAVFDGYHSVTVLVDNRPDGPRVYWADQWRIDPGDDFHQAPGSVSGFRRYEKEGFDTFINEQTRRWWNEVHSPDSKCAERARARGRNWDGFCRYPATLHIWKFRSALEQRGGRQ